MAEIIAIASGKGGTGKTTLTAGLAVALVAHRHKILCIDMDLGFRNLDLSLGIAEGVLMDFTDVALGRCQLSRGVTHHETIEELDFLTAPMYLEDEITPQMIAPLFDEAKTQYDYILIDCPAGIGRGFTLATYFADRVLMVATCDPGTLRGARRTVEEFAHEGHLVVNQVDRRALQKAGTTIDDAIDAVGLPLIGIVPRDIQIQLSANQGKVVTKQGKTGAGVAFDHIAQRIMGRRIPLMNI